MPGPISGGGGAAVLYEAQTLTAAQANQAVTNLATATMVDSSCVDVRDEFMGGTNSDGQIGEMGWRSGNIAGSGSFGYPGVESGHDGVCQVVSGSAGAGNASYIDLAGSGNFTIYGLGTTANWEMRWVFRLTATTDNRFRIGAANSAAIDPTGLIGLRYDTEAGFADTNFMFVCRNGATITATSSGVAADTAWHTLKMRSTTAGTILFSLDGGAETSITTGTPVGILAPIAISGTNAAAAKTVLLDFFGYRRSGLSR